MLRATNTKTAPGSGHGNLSLSCQSGSFSCSVMGGSLRAERLQSSRLDFDLPHPIKPNGMEASTL
jgi:hypothetical protein